jgi:hypothetical protein
MEGADGMSTRDAKATSTNRLLAADDAQGVKAIGAMHGPDDERIGG